MSGYGGTPSPKIAKYKQTEKEVPKGWLAGLKNDAVTFLKGDSTSGWAILAETVIGCVPILGQLADARDIIKAITTLAVNPNNPMGWFDLITALIGLVPGGGDAVKGGLRAVKKQNIPIDDLLDMIRKVYTGDPEKIIKKALDVSALQKTLDNILTSPAVLNQLDKPTRQAVETIRKNLNTQFASFKKEVDSWLPQTRRTSATPTAVKRNTSAQSGKVKPATGTQAGSKAKQQTSNNGSTNSTVTSSLGQKALEKFSNKVKGIMGEHMADYYCQDIKGWGKGTVKHDSGMVNSHKLNDEGKLLELFSLSARGRGIDAVWKTNGSPKDYAIIEAKCYKDPTLSLTDLLGKADDKTGADLQADIEDTSGSNIGGKKKKKKTNSRGGAMDTGGERSRDLKGKVPQMSHNWIDTRLFKIKLIDDKAKDYLLEHKQKSYIRMVVFFSISMPVAQHAAALALKLARKPVTASDHAKHDPIRVWYDSDIAKVVDNRAGLVNGQRSKFNRNK